MTARKNGSTEVRKGFTENLERTKRYLMTRSGIGFFKAILESYEDVALFSVIDGDRGLVELIYPSHFEEVLKAIMADMSRYGILFREADDV